MKTEQEKKEAEKLRQKKIRSTPEYRERHKKHEAKRRKSPEYKEWAKEYARKIGHVPKNMMLCVGCGAEVERLESVAQGWKNIHIGKGTKGLCPECQ